MKKEQEIKEKGKGNIGEKKKEGEKKVISFLKTVFFEFCSVDGT